VPTTKSQRSRMQGRHQHTCTPSRIQQRNRRWAKASGFDRRSPPLGLHRFPSGNPAFARYRQLKSEHTNTELRQTAFELIDTSEPDRRLDTELNAESGNVDRNEGNDMEAFDELMSEVELAQKLHVSLACLRRWRLERRGPPFIKLGSLVRYSTRDLTAWLSSLPTGGSQRVSSATGANVTPARRRTSIAS
jgi:hypothetical protein